jgi:methanogenic corrinoid protein MtbC1
LGTVKGDFQDMCKNLVGMMFEGAAFQFIDLGANTGATR